MTLQEPHENVGDERDSPLAGQNIDRVQQVFVGRPRAGSIHSSEYP